MATNTSIKFCKVDGLVYENLIVGAVYFDTVGGTIHVATSDTTTDKFGGNISDVSWDEENSSLNILKHDGTEISLDFSDMASASAVVEALKSKADIDEDGYVYSHGEKVDMRFTRSLLPVGTSIPASTNLNTIQYLKIGKYYCSLNVDAETITNCPVKVAFSMEVFNPLGTNVDDETTKEYTYRLRIITQYDSGTQYMQFCKTSGTAGSWTYGDWYASPRTKATLNSNKKGSTMTLGSATQGVYVASTGILTKMTYTLGKSVPSSAVFTDTKVTAVENHYDPAEDSSVQLDAPEGEYITGLKRDAAGHVVDVISSSATNAEYVTKEDLSTALDESTEVWTFTLADGSVVTKNVVVRCSDKT